MGFLDKFLNVMRLNPDEEDDFFNEDYDFDEDDYVEEKPAKSSFKAKKEKEQGYIQHHLGNEPQHRVIVAPFLLHIILLFRNVFDGRIALPRA